LPKSRRDENRPIRTRKRSEKPDDERTANVHDKGAERKKLTRAFSNKSRHPESRSSPKCAAEHYRNLTEHKKLPGAWKESSAHAVFRAQSLSGQTANSIALREF